MIYYVIKHLIYFAFDPFMTHFRMKVVPRRKPEKPSPPVLSNDWIIQNHGDIGKGLFSQKSDFAVFPSNNKNDVIN